MALKVSLPHRNPTIDMVKNGNKEVIKMSKKLFGVAVFLFQQHLKNPPDVINMWTCFDKYSKNDAKIQNRNKSTTAILNNNLSKRVFLGPRYFL